MAISWAPQTFPILNWINSLTNCAQRTVNTRTQPNGWNVCKQLNGKRCYWWVTMLEGSTRKQAKESRATLWWLHIKHCSFGFEESHCISCGNECFERGTRWWETSLLENGMVWMRIQIDCNRAQSLVLDIVGAVAHFSFIEEVWDLQAWRRILSSNSLGNIENAITARHSSRLNLDLSHIYK